MADWTSATLGQVCADGVIQTGPFGSQLHAEDYVDEGVPVVMPANISSGRIDESGIARINESDALRLSRHRLQVGDIVYSRRGDITRCARITEREEGWLCGTGCLLVRPGSGADHRWLAYWLSTPWTHEWLYRHAVGATMLNLNTSILASLPVELPPLEEQRRTASALGALDEAIENEGRLAAAADDLWRCALRARSRTWEQLRLIDMATFSNGRNFTKGASGAGRPVIRTPEVRTGPSAVTIRSQQDAPVDNIARYGDILFVWSGSLLVGRWVWEPGLVNQHIFKVIPRDGVPDWLTLWAIEELMDDFMGVAADKATTMGHIKRSDLDRSVGVPSLRSWTELDVIIRPLWEQALESRLAANQIAKVRDELLPLLMSGQLRVSECFEVA